LIVVVVVVVDVVVVVWNAKIKNVLCFFF